MKKIIQQPITWMVSGALLLGALVMTLVVVLKPQSPIPADVLSRLNFPVFYPDSVTGYEVDKDSVAYNAHAKVLIFHTKSSSQDFTISEQATPDEFNDIPDYYSKLIDKLHGYSNFDSVNGKVSLTRPEEFKGAQQAVFNGKGTLMFVHPAHEMSDSDWRKYFNAQAMTRPN